MVISRSRSKASLTKTKEIKAPKVESTDKTQYETLLCLELLTRGGLDKDEIKALKTSLSKGDLSKAKEVCNSYDLHPRGNDSKEVLNGVLHGLGMTIEGSSSQGGYSVVYTTRKPKDPLEYTHLIGEYRHLSDIGNALRKMESFPGERGNDFLALYSWSPKLNKSNGGREGKENKLINPISIKTMPSAKSGNGNGSKNQVLDIGTSKTLRSKNKKNVSLV